MVVVQELSNLRGDKHISWLGGSIIDGIHRSIDWARKEGCFNSDRPKKFKFYVDTELKSAKFGRFEQDGE